MLRGAIGVVLLLLATAAPGSTESSHTEYPSVLKEGATYHMWYSAYGEDGSGVQAWRIHYATSSDGVQWRRHGVVLDRGAAGTWEESGVAFPAVIRRGGQYRMWYGGQTQGHYAIGVASSVDGMHWTRDRANPVLVAEPREDGWETGGLLDPAVVYDEAKDRYLMWFNCVGRLYGYGLAVSPDGIHWTRHGANPVLTGGPWPDWDSTGPYTIAVLTEGRGYRAWYAVGLNGRGASLGTATSADGVHWEKSGRNPFSPGPVGSGDAWNSFGDFFYGAFVLRDGDVLKMWVNGISGANAPYGSIAYATSRDGVRWRLHEASPVLCPDGWPGDANPRPRTGAP